MLSVYSKMRNGLLGPHRPQLTFRRLQLRMLESDWLAFILARAVSTKYRIIYSSLSPSSRAASLRVHASPAGLPCSAVAGTVAGTKHV